MNSFLYGLSQIVAIYLMCAVTLIAITKFIPVEDNKLKPSIHSTLASMIRITALSLAVVLLLSLVLAYIVHFDGTSTPRKFLQRQPAFVDTLFIFLRTAFATITDPFTGEPFSIEPYVGDAWGAQTLFQGYTTFCGICLVGVPLAIGTRRLLLPPIVHVAAHHTIAFVACIIAMLFGTAFAVYRFGLYDEAHTAGGWMFAYFKKFFIELFTLVAFIAYFPLAMLAILIVFGSTVAIYLAACFAIARLARALAFDSMQFAIVVGYICALLVCAAIIAFVPVSDRSAFARFLGGFLAGAAIGWVTYLAVGLFGGLDLKVLAPETGKSGYRKRKGRFHR